MRRLIPLGLVLAASLATSAFALQVKVVGDRMTIHAKDVPLEDVLRQLQHFGAAVSVDPSIRYTVNANFEDQDVQKVLKSVLSPFDYVIEWDVVRTPLGPWMRLAEVQVFKSGEKKRLTKLAPPSSNAIGVRGPTPNSPVFVKDEILLAVNPHTDLAAFKRFLAQIGGTVVECIPELGIYRIRLIPGTNVPDLVEQLKQNPLVRNVEPNYLYRAPTPVLTASGSTPAALRSLSASTDGSAAKAVAILDTGLSSGVGLDKLLVASLDAVDPSQPISDKEGHGTQMALIASGAVLPTGTTGSTSVDGVPVIAIQAFDDNGYASSYGIMRSVNFSIANGARVLSMSWGSEVNSSFLQDALAYAASQGVISVAAAGNEPTGKTMYPAGYDGVIAVSALLPDGTIWDQSNYGSFVTLSAPAVASLPVGYRGPAGTYIGTSISAAYVASTIGRYMAEHTNATPAQVVTALTKSLTDAGPKGYDPHYGIGALDAAAVARFLK